MLIAPRNAQAQTAISGRVALLGDVLVAPLTPEAILRPRSLVGHSPTDDYEHSKWWMRMSAKHHTPQPKRSRRTAERFAIDALEKRVRRIERNYQRDLAKAVRYAYEVGWHDAQP